MNCNKVELLLSSYMDGELSQQEGGLVKGHIDSCTHCKELYSKFKNYDHLLRDALTPIRTETKKLVLNPLAQKKTLKPFLAPLASVAAGLIIAIAIFFIVDNKRLSDRIASLEEKKGITKEDLINAKLQKLAEENDELRKEKEFFSKQVDNLKAQFEFISKEFGSVKELYEKYHQLNEVNLKLKSGYENTAKKIKEIKEMYELALAKLEKLGGGIGQVTLALGGLEIRSHDTKVSSWIPIQTGTWLSANSEIRTSKNTKSVIILKDGSEIRLNEETYLTIGSDRKITLEKGEIWASIKKSDKEDFVIHTKFGIIEAKGPEIDVTVNASKTILVVLKGNAIITELSKKLPKTESIDTNNMAIVDSNSISKPTTLSFLDLDKSTRWTADILAAKGHDNPELIARISDLLEHMGKTKDPRTIEEAIKSYGNASIIPLINFIEFEKEGSQLREKAIKILSDTGNWEATQTFINLLTDYDIDIRVYASTALKRVTGTDLGYNTDFWKSMGKGKDPLENQRVGQKKWQEWWDKTKTKR